MFTTAAFALALLGLTSASPIPSTSSLEKRFSGARMTYYDTEVGLGACGAWHSNSEFTVALNSAQFGNSYPSQYCGQTVTISYGGKTTQASIQDACPSCPYGGLDLSEGLFSFFADHSVGVIYADWDFGGSVQQQQPTTSQAPTSTYVPPPPSTSSTPPPPTSTTPTSTYVAPSTSSTPAPSPSTSSTPAAASSSSSSSPVSSSVASSSVATTASSSAAAATTASTTDVNSLLGDLASTSTASLSLSGAAASATATGGASAVTVHSNLETLSELIVNMGRIVVLAG